MCGSKNSKEKTLKQADLEAELLRQEEERLQRQVRTRQIINHMREVLYLSQMKPFFEAG